MKNNLLNKSTAEIVIARAQNLQSSSEALWGKMTVTEMLHHCNKVHEELLAPAQPLDKNTSLKQYLLRWVVLYAMPRYPKGAQTPKKFRTQGVIDTNQFEKERQAFIASIARFASHVQPIDHFHPYFGKLSTEQWGLTSWKHVDHHLRQFGV